MILLSLLLAAWAGWAGAADLRAPKPVVLPLAVPGAPAAAPAVPAAGDFRPGAEIPLAAALPGSLPPALPIAAPSGPKISVTGGNVTVPSAPGLGAARALGAELEKPGAAPEAALGAAFDGYPRTVRAHSLWTAAAPAGSRSKAIHLGAVSVSPVHALRLREIIAAARTTKTGRRVLKRAEALARERGPVPVSFAALDGDLGSYEYMDGRMELNRALLNGDPRLAAATLVHELVHVLQHAEGLPAEALELELEAHMLTLEFLDEAGLAPDSPFSRAARLRLELGPLELYSWMAPQLASKFFLRFSPPEEIADQLEEELDKLQQRLEKLPDTPKNRHRREKLRQLAQWTARDLELVRSPDGLARYRSLARRVHARAKRLSVKYAAEARKT